MGEIYTSTAVGEPVSEAARISTIKAVEGVTHLTQTHRPGELIYSHHSHTAFDIVTFTVITRHSPMQVPLCPPNGSCAPSRPSVGSVVSRPNLGSQTHTITRAHPNASLLIPPQRRSHAITLPHDILAMAITQPQAIAPTHTERQTDRDRQTETDRERDREHQTQMNEVLPVDGDTMRNGFALSLHQLNLTSSHRC